MRRYIAFAWTCLLATAPLFAADEPPIEGSAELAESKIKFTHIVAYSTKHRDEPAVAVLASDRLIDAKAIKAELDRNDGSDENVSLRQPHNKVVFDQAGKIASYSGRSSSFSTNGSNSAMSGELKRDGDKVSGSAKLVADGDERFRVGFEFKFATGLIGTSAEVAQKAAPLEKLGVSGKFIGNGKEAKLAFISAYPREAFDDKPCLTIVMTEKDHSRDKKPDFKAGFGDYGSALIISCQEDGEIFSTSIVHKAHQKQGFSSSGSINFVEFQIAGGQVQGKLKTDGEQEFFDDKWLVDLTLAAKYTAQKPAETKAPTSGRGDKPADKPADEPMPTKPQPTKPDPAKPAKPAAAKMKKSQVVLPKDATDVAFANIGITFKSPTEFKTLAKQYAKLLAEQGWKSDGSDLYGVSCILKRKLGEAELTIIVKPDGTGSTITIFTDGLEEDE